MTPKQLYRTITSSQRLQRRQKHPTNSKKHIIGNWINLLINAKSHGFDAYCPQSILWVGYIKHDEATP